MTHLKEINLTWNRHRAFAWHLAYRCFKCTLIFLVHGLLPFAWVRSGSEEIHSLNKHLNEE